VLSKSYADTSVLPPQTAEHEELHFAAEEEVIPRSNDILHVDAQQRAALSIGGALE
jgi:hypothetical protein